MLQEQLHKETGLAVDEQEFILQNGDGVDPGEPVVQCWKELVRINVKECRFEGERARSVSRVDDILLKTLHSPILVCSSLGSKIFFLFALSRLNACSFV